MLKTPEFVRKLNNKIYQYTFNKKYPPVLKGSFKTATYISDIDYTVYVYFNQRFIDILIRKIRSLRDFRFVYLNAGVDKRFRLPWVINPEWGCDFDLTKTRRWFNIFKDQKLVPPETIRSIKGILDKKKLMLGDLIDIQEYLNKYSTIRWYLPDIIRRQKNIGGHTYILLDELKKEDGPVLNSLYIDGKNIVSVDIGLVDRRYKHPIWSRMYKYYTQNWYRILKSYKKMISRDYSREYYSVMKKMEYDNSLLAQTQLLKTLLRYQPVSSSTINNVAYTLHIRLNDLGIDSRDLNEIEYILTNRLNELSKPYVNYFLDKLNDDGKIKTIKRLRLVEISKNPTRDRVLIERRKEGIDCPFFPPEIEEKIDNLSATLLLDKKKVRNCLYKVSVMENIPIDTLLSRYIDKAQVSRLFLQYGSDNNILVRGVFNPQNHRVFGSLGNTEHGYYTLDVKYLKLLQAYLLF